MIDRDARAVTETVFEISDALKLEEERHAAVIKNMHRLRALRLSRKQSRKHEL